MVMLNKWIQADSEVDLSLQHLVQDLAANGTPILHMSTVTDDGVMAVKTEVRFLPCLLLFTLSDPSWLTGL